jgi:hypothetical protein
MSSLQCGVLGEELGFQEEVYDERGRVEEAQPNVLIDATKFAKSVPSVPPK